MKNTKTCDILIIGAGSVGTPLAYSLANAGASVVVLDKYPSSGQGQNKSAIGGIRATHSDPAKIKIGQITLDIIRRMESEHGFDVDWVEGGYMFPVYDEENERTLKHLLEYQKHFNLHIDWITADKVESLAPGINTKNLRGGTYSPEDGSASPMKVMDAFYQLARHSGAEFYFSEPVIDIQKSGRKIEKVITPNYEFLADLVINTAGADAAEIGKMVGLEIPVFPESHEGGITEPVQRFFEPMIVDIRPDAGSKNYYFYQNGEGQVVFCITPEPIIPGKDRDNTSDFLPMVIKRMVNLYPRLRNLRVRRIWRGLYPMTPDGFPIVGYTKEIDNLMLAVGMCGQGFMLGPGLGEILADIIINNSNEHEDVLKQLSLYRKFTGNEKLK